METTKYDNEFSDLRLDDFDDKSKDNFTTINTAMGRNQEHLDNVAGRLDKIETTNNFKVTNGGTEAVLARASSDLFKVERTALGTVVGTYLESIGKLAAIPCLHPQAINSDSDVNAKVLESTLTGFTILTKIEGGADVDSDFDLLVRL